MAEGHLTTGAEVESTSPTFWRRVAAYGWLLALVGLTGPAATVAALAAMLHGIGAEATRLGSTLVVGAMDPQVVGPLATAMPVVVVGGALILATPATLAQQVRGLSFLAVNAWLVSLMVLGVAVQVPPGQAESVRQTLAIAAPAMLALVLAAGLLYYRLRIVPEPALAAGRGHLATGQGDLADG